MADLVRRGDCRAIVDDVFELALAEWGFLYRAYLVDRDVPTLFDTGWAETTAELFDAVEATGRVPERLVLTHGDPDHVGGFDAAVDRYGVETWVPVETDLDTENAADHRFGDRERIGPFEAVHVPGHTPDSYAFIDEGAGMAVTGDVVNGSDVRGLPPGHLVLPPEVFTADLHAAERNLEKLLAYDFELALVSHGSIVTDDATEKLRRFVRFPGHPADR